jgi:hypothetical protein
MDGISEWFSENVFMEISRSMQAGVSRTELFPPIFRQRVLEPRLSGAVATSISKCYLEENISVYIRR